MSARLQRRDPMPPPRRGGIGLRAAVVIGLALVVGIQLGAIPWRFRREIWQLQGAAVGLVVGYLLGRANGGRE